MPAPPEIGDGVGQVGIVEVFLVAEAHHQAHANGHVGVGGEVQVDLHSVGKAAQPQRQSGGVFQGGQVGGLVRRGAA